MTAETSSDAVKKIAIEHNNSSGFFAVKDCALIAIATDKKVLTLREFRDALAVIDLDSIYYHFWGWLLQSRFEEREYNNDFASWVWYGLHDPILAERLAVIDPTTYTELDELRQILVEAVEDRLDESEELRWRVATRQFEFIRSQIVVFNTRKSFSLPEELADTLKSMSTSSVFYHFIDARRRITGNSNDFSQWLCDCWGECHKELMKKLNQVDPYFVSLSNLRQELAQMIKRYFKEQKDGFQT